ncbi:MAG: hypothetical protein Q7Q71_07155 [Verrucomicrobiota bacterium JB023]|nr:hypothetical protein [Verrucomicrobiota bacterium JB023]
MTCALTLPGDDPGPEAFKEAFKTLKRRWCKRWSHIGAHWKEEPQKRGALHAHLLIYLDGIGENEETDFRMWLMLEWNKLIGNRDSKHLRWHMHSKNWQRPRKHFAAYFAKYLGKADESDPAFHPGRWWGHVNRKSIPYGKHLVTELPQQEAVKLHRIARKLRQRKAEIAHRKKVMRKIFGESEPSWTWENLCQGHGAPTPEKAKLGVSLMKKVARAKKLSWARPKLPKQGDIFLNIELPKQLLANIEIVFPHSPVHPRPIESLILPLSIR